MKEKTKYLVTIILTLVFGITGTLITLKETGYLDSKIVEKTVKEVSITEADSLNESVNKLYNAVVYIEAKRGTRSMGSGSGFVYKSDDKYAYILTNQHVISNGTTIEITNIDKSSYEATVVGSDEYSDIAVLKVDRNKVLAVASIGSNETSKLGDRIFTVGSPLGKDYMGSVTSGIISGLNRNITTSNGTSMEVIQVDAALNPGNSGGPLANINGEVIGINSLKLVENEIEGMGFAIPIELAKTIADKLEQTGSIERPMLGVSMIDVDNAYQLYKYSITLDEGIDAGAVVVEVSDDSPAEKAGLKKGDVILAINNNDIKNVAGLKTELYKYSVGDTITIKYYRNNSIKQAKVKLDVTLQSQNS